ncbi:hypothetical protein VCRA2122O265_10033 [Vibrio crassostreae]|nr:hypothetical protein VCRA2112O187_1630004 [Vibrio crassostreae]CAK1823618.1 hypothetical protein VCRA2113O207_10138 [Vibrio crassostreae]CAK1847198.1 hypothetical protein VCRA2113O213_10231 [Vibrio crassostreae]CAK1850388.1 hypothetical protein VCRA2113O218_10232 [Vibrio crassostreae]CAK1852153.1 hypothetical protein VCRA2112O192_10232 [Vibrio crassostreae]
MNFKTTIMMACFTANHIKVYVKNNVLNLLKRVYGHVSKVKLFTRCNRISFSDYRLLSC